MQISKTSWLGKSAHLAHSRKNRQADAFQEWGPPGSELLSAKSQRLSKLCGLQSPRRKVGAGLFQVQSKWSLRICSGTVVKGSDLALNTQCSENIPCVRCEQTPGFYRQCLFVIYLCPFERFHRTILHTRRALPNVQGVMEKGTILCCKLKRPVPNGGEFQTLFVTQLDISADSKFLQNKIFEHLWKDVKWKIFLNTFLFCDEPLTI